MFQKILFRSKLDVILCKKRQTLSILSKYEIIVVPSHVVRTIEE